MHSAGTLASTCPPGCWPRTNQGHDGDQHSVILARAGGVRPPSPPQPQDCGIVKLQYCGPNDCFCFFSLQGDIVVWSDDGEICWKRQIGDHVEEFAVAFPAESPSPGTDSSEPTEAPPFTLPSRPSGDESIDLDPSAKWKTLPSAGEAPQPSFFDASPGVDIDSNSPNVLHNHRDGGTVPGALHTHFIRHSHPAQGLPFTNDGYANLDPRLFPDGNRPEKLVLDNEDQSKLADLGIASDAANDHETMPQHAPFQQQLADPNGVFHQNPYMLPPMAQMGYYPQAVPQGGPMIPYGPAYMHMPQHSNRMNATQSVPLPNQFQQQYSTVPSLGNGEVPTSPMEQHDPCLLLKGTRTRRAESSGEIGLAPEEAGAPNLQAPPRKAVRFIMPAPNKKLRKGIDLMPDQQCKQSEDTAQAALGMLDEPENSGVAVPTTPSKQSGPMLLGREQQRNSFLEAIAELGHPAGNDFRKQTEAERNYEATPPGAPSILGTGSRNDIKAELKRSLEPDAEFKDWSDSQQPLARPKAKKGKSTGRKRTRSGASMPSGAAEVNDRESDPSVPSNADVLQLPKLSGDKSTNLAKANEKPLMAKRVQKNVPNLTGSREVCQQNSSLPTIESSTYRLYPFQSLAQDFQDWVVRPAKAKTFPKGTTSEKGAPTSASAAKVRVVLTNSPLSGADDADGRSP
ncbi:MAG: hypothetical protein Q9168_006504 [Polycauliona sp. 1 TL-2023]